MTRVFRTTALAIAAIGLIPSVRACATPHPAVVRRSPLESDFSSTSPRKAEYDTGKLSYLDNTGVCETTPGVFQASGYADLTSDQHMWWWFFGARDDPESAPIAIWINGGPGASSMLGLFQENGNGTAYTNNTYSWNNNVNMLYIDQPVGVGYSYGKRQVYSAKEAADAVWRMLQIFYKDPNFSRFSNNSLALWTESYGGHYGPVFAHHFLQQNDAIANGSVSGVHINFKTLGIGNGLTDPLNQYPGYMTYASSNPYLATANESVIATANNSFYEEGGCRDQILQCYANGTDKLCAGAESCCMENVLRPLGSSRGAYDVRQINNSDYPPDITPLLTNQSFIKQIGAKANWSEVDDDVYEHFSATGDYMRNSAQDLEAVINAGVRTVIYDGDADFIVNYVGVEAMVDKLNTQYTSLYAQQQFTNYTVDGHVAGIVKNAGNFSYLRVYGAGHEVPAYNYTSLETGQAALQFFEQAMRGELLNST